MSVLLSDVLSGQRFQKLFLGLGGSACLMSDLKYANSIGDLPRTTIFFSGSRFPLATPSSIEDHMSFLASSLLGLSWSLEDETCVYVEVL